MVLMSYVLKGWVFKPGKEENTTNCMYQLQIDPKGWLPTWLVNMLFVDNPIEVYSNLNAMLNKK